MASLKQLKQELADLREADETLMPNKQAIIADLEQEIEKMEKKQSSGKTPSTTTKKKESKPGKDASCDDEVKVLRNQLKEAQAENRVLSEKLSTKKQGRKETVSKAVLTKKTKKKKDSGTKTKKDDKTNLPVPTSKKTVKETKTKNNKTSKTTQKEPKGVFAISKQVALIKRFVGLFVGNKTQKHLENLLVAIKKALLVGEIKKTDTYSSQIMEIQKELVNGLNRKGEVKLNVPTEKEMAMLRDIAASEKVLLSVTYLKQYLSLSKNQDKVKMKRLADRIKVAIEKQAITAKDPYWKEIKKAFGKLNSGTIKLPANELAGLEGICKCGNTHTSQKKSTSRKTLNGVELSAGDLSNLNLQTLGFQGAWRELMGDPVAPFHVVVYGLPKGGKSYLIMMLADYLHSFFGDTLYVASEEFGSPTLVTKVQELEINPNITFRGDMPNDLSKYKFLFLDSANKAGINFEDWEEIKKSNPQMSTIAVLQTTKEGNFKGGQEWTHNADIVIEVINGVATARGRYGTGEMFIFDEINYRKKALKKYA